MMLKSRNYSDHSIIQAGGELRRYLVWLDCCLKTKVGLGALRCLPRATGKPRRMATL